MAVSEKVREQFAIGVLQRITKLRPDLKITPNRENVAALVAQSYAEGGHDNGALYNLFNTTQPADGAGNTGTQGNIKVYRSWDQGIDATARTYINGNYNGVLSAFAHGSAEQIVDAIGASPWGTHSDLMRSVLASRVKLSTKLPSAKLTGGTGGGYSASGTVPKTGGGSILDLSDLRHSAAKVLLTVVGILAGAGLIVFGASRATGLKGAPA